MFQRILAFFGGKSRSKSNYSHLSAEALMSAAEGFMFEAAKSYKPLIEGKGARFAKAEYAAFMYFWVRHWHDRLPEEMRSYSGFLDLVRWKAEDGAIAIRSYGSIHRDWESEEWFEDRVRIYRNIVTEEPQTGSPSGPPSSFAACHMLATIAAERSRLDLKPEINQSADLLEECLRRGTFPDAVEQYHMYTSARDAFGAFIQPLTEVLTEMHLRRR